MAKWLEDEDTRLRFIEVAGEVHGRCAAYLEDQGLDPEMALRASLAWSQLGAVHAGLATGIPSAESPIEVLFIQAMQYHKLVNRINLHAQVPIGRYRVDFLVFALGDPYGVIVEVDGHEFHEKTKEQAEHDKKRDRYLTGEGYRVLRFTGREVWRDPHACADEATEARLQEFLRLGGGGVS